jgi:hypothetical protein
MKQENNVPHRRERVTLDADLAAMMGDDGPKAQIRGSTMGVMGT